MNQRQCPRFAIRLLGLFMVILALGVTASAEWNEKVLYSFQGGTDGQLPVGSIVFDSAGNLYGATTQGGATNCSPLADCGTVFQLTPPPKQGDPWTETVLYTFKGAKYGDGDEPAGGLLIDSQGNLYGTTAYGGTGDCVLLGVEGGCGTVFELSPPSEKGGAWTETILYSFPTAKQGYLPNGDLVFDSAGNLYGATQYGGGKGTTCDRFYQYCGAVFELSPPKAKGGKWTEEVLHAFAGGTDGANPNGGLVLNGNGAVYGTTNSGGNQSCQYEGQIGCGTAFELKPPTKKGGGWSEAVLHHFDRTSSDGGNPMAGMVFDAKSRLYGITLNGGPGGGGVVFRLSLSKKPGSWTEAILYGFNGDTGGYDPEGALIFDASGNLYGTTNVGRGGSLRGNVFQLKQPSGKDRAWTLSTIHGFTGIPDGENPTSRLTSDKAGNLYSTT